MRLSFFCFLIVILLISSAPVLCQLPGLAPPSRPVTTLTMQKSGNNIVLNWSTTPNGSYDYVVCRGIAHPEYRAEVVIATLTNGETTYTDTNALTRTRQGYYISEFYRIYAVPKNYKALAGNTLQNENSHRIKNSSVDIAVVATNGDVITVYPETYYKTMRFPIIKVNSNKADLDLYNLPDIPENIGVLLRPSESYPRTVAHAGYQSAVYDETPQADVVVTTIVRQLPKPSISRDGNIVSIQWNALTYDYDNAIANIRVIRTYLGVGDNEPSKVVATLSKTATETQDDISDVPSNYYVFYQIAVIYVDGTVSDMSPSSDWIKK